MPADLIIYAIVAVGLILWLRGVLGTRHGEERQRPNPFGENSDDAPGVKTLKLNDMPVPPEQKLAALTQGQGPPGRVENKTAENALLDMIRADKTFDPKTFLHNAQDAFAIVTEAFGEGDLATLKDLLAPNVYAGFERAIEERKARGETQRIEIQAVRQADVIAAKLDGKQASITVKFKADEVSVRKDSFGNVIAGHPEKSGEIRDIWTFSRDLPGRDPRWMVSETRGGFEDDNDIIPNA